MPAWRLRCPSTQLHSFSLYLVLFLSSRIDLVDNFFVPLHPPMLAPSILFKQAISSCIHRSYTNPSSPYNPICWHGNSQHTINLHLLPSKQLTMANGQISAGNISVYAWLCIAGAILFVLIVTAILLKTMRGRRLQKRQRRVDEGDAIFGPIIQKPLPALRK